MSYSLEVYYHGEWHLCEVTVEKINATKLIFKELELNLDECILTQYKDYIQRGVCRIHTEASGPKQELVVLRDTMRGSVSFFCEVVRSFGCVFSGYKEYIIESQFIGPNSSIYKVKTLKNEDRILKVVPTDCSLADDLKNEVRTLMSLRHPFINGCFGIFTDGFSMVMECEAQQTDLLNLLNSKGKIPIYEALPLVTSIMHAVDFLHFSGFVHRDIKPDNILIGKFWKLADFGFVKKNKAEFILEKRGTLGSAVFCTSFAFKIDISHKNKSLGRIETHRYTAPEIMTSTWPYDIDGVLMSGLTLRKNLDVVYEVLVTKVSTLRQDPLRSLLLL